MKKGIKTAAQGDKELVEALATGSKSALEYIYGHYYPVILRFILLNNGDEDDAKDIFQETVIVLHSRAQEGHFELSSKLGTFLYSVARRLWLKKLSQRNRRTGSLEEVDEVVPVEQDLEQHEAKDIQFTMMEGALSKLGEPCKTIIEDFYLHSHSMQDICEKFGYTNADNAKNQKYKCLQRLKKLFFQEQINLK